MLEYASRAEPQVVLVVRTLGRRGVGSEEDLCLAVERDLLALRSTRRDRLQRFSVEGEVLPGLHVGVVALPVAPLGLASVHHRPAQTAHTVIGVEVREIVSISQPELPVFVPQGLVDEEAEILGDVVRVSVGDGVGPLHALVLGAREEHLVEGLVRFVSHLLRLGEHVREFPVLEALGRESGQGLLVPHLGEREALRELQDLPEVSLGVTRCLYLLSPVLRAPLRVSVGAPLFVDHRDGEHQIGHLGRNGRIAVRHHDEVVLLAGRPDPLVRIGKVLERIGHH